MGLELYYEWSWRQKSTLVIILKAKDHEVSFKLCSPALLSHKIEAAIGVISFQPLKST